MDKYEFHNAFNTLYSFIWDDYCSSYIEISKIYLNDILLQDVEDLDVVVNVKNNVLKKIQHQLLISYQHPCMKCNNINTVLHTEQEVLNDVIASIEVVELYKYYTNMQYNYQMSHADLDNMYSFEQYRELVDKYVEIDVREINFQNRVILSHKAYTKWPKN